MTSRELMPLRCNICPKKPLFSDISHLLTHVGSKGHLSHYFKVKVRAGREETSRQLLKSYDRWYNDWGVDDLMSDRMNLKDSKRSRQRTTVSARTIPTPVTTVRRSTRIPRTRQGTGSALPLRDGDDDTSTYPQPLESDFLGATRSNGPFQTPLNTRPLPYTGRDWTDSRSESVVSVFGTKSLELDSILSETSDTSDPLSRLNGEGSVDTKILPLSDSARLKGVYWPGMDIFDSATADMRRKRNQKKDISVVEKLEANSVDVEPTEMVFTPLGSLKKQRKISGLPDENSSPPPMDSSPLGPRPLRRPLGSLDVNQPYFGNREGRHSRWGPQIPQWDNPFEDPDTDAEDQGRRYKRAFDIFCDEDITLTNPLPMSYLTSGFPAPVQQQGVYANPFDFEQLDFKTFDDQFQTPDRATFGHRIDPQKPSNADPFQSSSGLQPPFGANAHPDIGGLLPNPLCFDSYQAEDAPYAFADIPSET